MTYVPFQPTARTAEQAWRARLLDVLECGYEVAPRGLPTLERLHPPPMVFSLERPVVVCPERKLNRQFMVTEPLLALSGDNRVSSLAPYIKGMRKYSDDGETFRGAYGPMIVDQLPWCVDQLLADRDTRQSVLTIWRPRPGPSKDVPCCVSMGFNIRNGYFNALVHMRASDVWLGCPYDLFTFSMIAWRALLWYNSREDPALPLVVPGQLAFMATNSQVYLEHLEEATRVAALPLSGRGPKFDLPSNGTWEELEQRLLLMRSHPEGADWNDEP